MRRALPANPLSVQLSVAHHRSWSQVGQTDAQPEQWRVSADMSSPQGAFEEALHVGDISLALADLTVQRDQADASVLGDWALEFVSELVAAPGRGTLHPDLESRFNSGPPYLIIVRHISVTEPWRGYGLGAALTAAALLMLSRYARLAACHVTPHVFADAGQDRVSAELATVRIGTMLESIGFQRWQGAYVVDLQSPTLQETRLRVIEQWWPHEDETGPL